MPKLSEITGDPQSGMTLSDLIGGKKRKPAAYRVASQIPGGETVLGALDGLQHHGMNALHGLAQSAEHLANYATGGRVDAIRNTMQADDAALRQREADYQARTDGNAGSYVGAAVGEIAPWMVGIGEARALGLLPKASGLLSKAGALSAEGGLMGAAQPVTGAGSYASQKGQQVGYGAVGGAVLPYLGKAAGIAGDAGGGLLNRFIAPEKAADARVLRTLTPDMLPALERGTGVPGVVPTVAEAVPSPAAVKLERKLRNDPINGLPFANQDVANNRARMDVIRGIAGDEAGMTAARNARFNATNPYYSGLAAKRVDPTSVIQALDALHNSSLGVNKNVKSAVASLRDEITSRTGQDGMIGADILSGLHENVGSHLDPMASAKERFALGPIKDSIVNAIDAGVPGYRANNQAFATLSGPINDMDAARRVLDEAGYNSLNPGGDPVATLNILKKALKSDDKASFGFSPQARAQMEGVLSSLQARSTTNNTLAAAGSNTLADSLLANKHLPLVKAGVGASIGGLLGHLGLPGGEALGGGLGLLATGALSHANGRVGLLTAERMANAEKAAAILRNAQLRQRGLLGNIPAYLLPYAQ